MVRLINQNRTNNEIMYVEKNLESLDTSRRASVEKCDENKGDEIVRYVKGHSMVSAYPF